LSVCLPVCSSVRRSVGLSVPRRRMHSWFVTFPRLSLSSSCAQVHSRELLRKGSEMAAKLVSLRKLTTAIRNFSVKVRLEGSLAEEEYMHQESGERRRYVSCAGVDGAGDRVSLAFFGPSVESLAGISVGDTVEMRGGQVRIRDGAYSVSTVPVDLVFDRYGKFSKVEAVDGKVTAQCEVISVAAMRAGAASDVMVIYLGHEGIVEVYGKKADKPFDKLVVHVCDPSTESRFEVEVLGKCASSVEEVVEKAAGGDALCLRAVFKRCFEKGFSLQVSRCGTAVLNPGGAEDAP